MKDITPKLLADISCKVEGLIALEIGARLPYISLIFIPGTDTLALFTNRKDNQEVLDALIHAAKVVRQGQEFHAIDGRMT